MSDNRCSVHLSVAIFPHEEQNRDLQLWGINRTDEQWGH